MTKAWRNFQADLQKAQLDGMLDWTLVIPVFAVRSLFRWRRRSVAGAGMSSRGPKRNRTDCWGAGD